MYTITPAGTHLSVTFPYRSLEQFKRIVPQGYRWWQPETRSWLISPHMLGALIDGAGADIAPLDYDCLRLAWPHTQRSVKRGKR